MFSLNEADRQKIQEAFSGILSRLIDASKFMEQLTFLNTFYSTIAAGRFIDFNIVKYIMRVSDIEDRLVDPISKVVFIANIMGTALYSLGRNDETIKSYDEAIRINPEYADAYYNKGVALSALGRKDEVIRSYVHLWFCS